jgi:DNA helicase-2/ATP-dependent DNA helicase PcrA
MGASSGGLREVVDTLTLGGETASTAEGVSLLSLHAAKGLEYDVVFIAGLEEGLLPHRRSLGDIQAVEEERRLCYVGMTRARERLYVSYTHARLLGGQALIGQASRFIGEMGRSDVVVTTSRRADARPRLPGVRPGERVIHPRWRRGTVLTVDGEGRDTLVTIHFETVGLRRLQLCHAPLTRDGEQHDVLAV